MSHKNQMAAIRDLIRIEVARVTKDSRQSGKAPAAAEGYAPPSRSPAMRLLMVNAFRSVGLVHPQSWRV